MVTIGIVLFLIGLALSGWFMTKQFGRRLDAYEERYLESTDAQLDVLLVFMAPDDLLRISRVAGVTVFLVICVLTLQTGIIPMFIFAGLAGFGAFYLPRVVLKVMLHFRRARFLEQFPDAIGMLNNAMKAGLGFMQAAEMVAKEAPNPVAQELAILCKDRHTGKSLDASLERLCERMPLVDVRIFAMVLRLSNRMGGNVTEALSRLAETIRNRFMVEKKVKSLTAEARMQAVVVCLLPFILFAAFAVLAPDMMEPLLSSAAGFVVLGAVLFLEIVGGFFMWKAAQIKY